MTRVALVHERFTEFGGSEAVVGEFVQTWSNSRVFAPIVEPSGVREPVRDVHDSWLSKAHRLTGGRHAPLLPLVSREFRRMPLRDFDVAVVSHHAFATQAALAAGAPPTVAYVHSPARWAWDKDFRAQEAGGRAGQTALAALGTLARRGELRAAPRLAHVVANSHAVADRVRDWWGLPATVVNPPVRVADFTPAPQLPREDFFLCAGRLVPYKRADLAIRAAQKAGVRLVVLGDGRFRTQLESIAGSETTFLGATSAALLLDMYRRCQALLMPGIEDFGIVPVEAMACGTPVLAVGAGGALDTVRPGVTGEYVPAGTDDDVVDALAETMRSFRSDRYDVTKIRAHADSFAPEVFRAKMAATVDKVLANQ
ncbi:glycosyltransferase [Nocardia camponoti]|uniref:Glycosyl transferase n=1 Tax=Nocardia camponoti TaxID=1616106 RepID=A0A917Q7B8_9NOCA|nr:glycosyltransferase [Nocardia camponoti]GGK33478.1 putative glycosyl transferase [Nocardia camponoti]